MATVSLKGKTIKSYYFLGIGGIGMSALARYFKAKGFAVAGYDKTRTLLTDTLVAEGIDVIYTDDKELVGAEFLNSENCELVFTPAVPKDLGLLQEFRSVGFIPKKRAEILGQISKRNDTLAVAGTHGKTTTTAILAHLMHCSGVDCTAFIGGIANNFGSNYVIGTAPVMAVEADEFDRSFLQLDPLHAVINSMDADHLDIYGSADQLTAGFKEFSKLVKGKLVAKIGLDIKADYRFSLEEKTDFYISEFKIAKGKSSFNLHFPNGESEHVDYVYPGLHNIENAIAAASLAYLYGVKPLAIAKGLGSFSGVKRRFDKWDFEQQVYIDDYAHHPAEIRALIQSVRRYYPSKEVLVIFQPHLFSRTRDFMDDFAESLALADKIMLLDIYPAREKPIEGINSHELAKRIDSVDVMVKSPEEILEILKVDRSDIIITMGAGDIDRMVGKIKTLLKTSS